MMFGVAKDIITPYRKSPMSGYSSYYNQSFQGIHDDLYVRAVLMDDGKRQIVLISVDLLFHDYELSRTVKAYAFEKYGIPPAGVVISYTHTHGGPSVRGYEDETQYSPDYEQFLLSRIQTCLDRVMVNPFAGTIGYGAVSGDWNVNRRGRLNGKIANRPNPDGPKDDQVPLLKICDQQGHMKVLLFSYACHPVTVKDELWISSDFPGRVCQLLESDCFGATAIFFQGAGGNARPKITVQGSVFVKRTFAEMDEMSRSIANRIRQTFYQDAAYASIELNLAASEFWIDLLIDPLPKERFEAVIHNERAGSPGYRNIARRLLERYDEAAELLKLPAGVIRLSEDLYIACMGGEPCYEVKQKLEAVFAGKRLLFIGYLDASAYIPDDSIIEEGGYEADGSAIEYGLKGSFQTGIDKSIRDAFTQAYQALLNEP